jgi:hypothetical protein
LAGHATIRTGPTIALEAINCDDELKWQTSLQPSDLAELERLREDGHDIKQRGRHYIISLSQSSVRACQLYRTLLHEVGHWVDFEKSTRQVAREDNSKITDRLEEYFARPISQREAFAHQYAISMQVFLKKFGIIPFDALQGDHIP